MQVYNAGDANAYVEMRRRNARRITADPGLIYFDGVTGQVLKATPLGPAMATQRWLTGFHMAAFAGWWLRWLYFALGLFACVTIAVGMLVWLEGRRTRSNDRAHRFVEGCVIASICGPLIATGAYLLCNRLLGEAAADRAQWELTAYFGAWGLSLLHAVLRLQLTRDRFAVWREQALAIGAVALAAVVADGFTSGGGLIAPLLAGQHAAAAVDAVLLSCALAAVATAYRLRSSGSAVA